MATYLLDYGAGNVQSLVNAVKYLGYELKVIKSPEDFDLAQKVIFPGVGAFGPAIEALEPYSAALKKYLSSNKPFMGICVGLQCLFESSTEAPDSKGLSLFKGEVSLFSSEDKSVPHMGWNTAKLQLTNAARTFGFDEEAHYYFVHSYAVKYTSEIKDYVLAVTRYGNEEFVSAVQYGNILATQFHPEKSGLAGLRILDAFLSGNDNNSNPAIINQLKHSKYPVTLGLTRRIIACLDVRSDDDGKLVVTKGDQYDVRDKKTGLVRNLGDPVEMAAQYFLDGADEICFLNITSFRNSPLRDQPMLKVLKETSKKVFVPLTIGGGVRDYVDVNGGKLTALQVADEYFRSGADKVSIGSDAVLAAEELLKTDIMTGNSSIEQISLKYGCQAVVVSIDPKKVGAEYQCTIKGGRELRDLTVQQLVVACQKLGAGEFLVNSMDQDGSSKGFDDILLGKVKALSLVPVIASSGAGCAQHFVQVFQNTNVDAALAAEIFHKKLVSIQQVKTEVAENNIAVRI